jgi:alkylhydroperoxidase family enzyme
MNPRMAPATAPFGAVIQGWLDRTLPAGMAPLSLFTTLARDERLFVKFFSGGLLDQGHLTLRQREIVIDRTTALCRSEYEWGVHVALFGSRIGLTQDQTYSLVHGNAEDACWGAEDRVLMRFCDSLHRNAAVGDELWEALRSHFGEEALLELLLLAGYYRTVSYLTNVLQLAPEGRSVSFPVKRAPEPM